MSGNFKLTVFELTVYFKHEMIGFLPNIHSNFELTVFELTVPDLYRQFRDKINQIAVSFVWGSVEIC